MADGCFLCSTDKGTVQKVIVLPRDDLQTEELVLEEVEVFKVNPSISHTLTRFTISIIVKLTEFLCFIFCFTHQGPNSYTDDEDLLQKGKQEQTVLDTFTGTSGEDV